MILCLGRDLGIVNGRTQAPVFGLFQETRAEKGRKHYSKALPEQGPSKTPTMTSSG